MYIVSVANHHNTEIKSRAANTINEARVILLDAFLEALKARDTILGEDGFPEPPKAGGDLRVLLRRRCHGAEGK